MAKANSAIWKRKLSILVLFLGLACGISTDPAVPPPCPMENLMIDLSLFPDDWYQQGPPWEKAATVSWGVEKLGVTFVSSVNGVAQQDVHRGRNVQKAKEGYPELASSWFHIREDETDWYTPTEFDYKSLVANQYRFGCQTHQSSSGEIETCQLVAQHEVYIMRFHTLMSPIMTYNDLGHILQDIDNKTAQCLAE